MIVKNLADLPFDELFHCFQSAFEHYYVKLSTDKSYYQQRWKASGVNFRFSYGMFDQGKLVGFVIHAVDHRQGALRAYNAGTGVLPEYRGNRIVASIYEYALKDLQQNDIEQCTLEVIVENEKAIRAYQSVGFEIKKKYLCFSGRLKENQLEIPEIMALDVNSIPWDELPNQTFYAWEHQKETVLAGTYSFFKVLSDGTWESFFIIKPENGYLAQFDVLTPDTAAWKRLFAAIQHISPTIKAINIDGRLVEKVAGLKRQGLENPLNQYEMELLIQQ